VSDKFFNRSEQRKRREQYLCSLCCLLFISSTFLLPAVTNKFVSTEENEENEGDAPDLRQSQRDCALQPRVARNELPWATVPEFNPERVASTK